MEHDTAITKGEKARLRLIEAAIDLLAEYGDSEKVSIRDIAARAGVNSSNITYHFQNRTALLKAVYDFLLAYGTNTPIRNFLDKNGEMLATKEGQSIFITNLFGAFRDFFLQLPQKQASRCKAYRVLAQSPEMPKTEENQPFYYKRDAIAFCEIYTRITGIDDFELAFSWFTIIFESLAKQFEPHGLPKKLDEDHVFSDQYSTRLLYFCNKRLLVGLGLWESKDAKLDIPAGGWI